MGFISHVDFRVQDAAQVLPLYDALFEALGLRPGPTRTAAKSYARWNTHGERIEWFNLFEDPAAQASLGRIAFRVETREQVDTVCRAIVPHARNVEGPDLIERRGAFNMSYYGMFFEDLFGNKFEVCHCIMHR